MLKWHLIFLLNYPNRYFLQSKIINEWCTCSDWRRDVASTATVQDLCIILPVNKSCVSAGAYICVLCLCDSRFVCLFVCVWECFCVWLFKIFASFCWSCLSACICVFVFQQVCMYLCVCEHPCMCVCFLCIFVYKCMYYVCVCIIYVHILVWFSVF